MKNEIHANFDDYKLMCAMESTPDKKACRFCCIYCDELKACEYACEGATNGVWENAEGIGKNCEYAYTHVSG